MTNQLPLLFAFAIFSALPAQDWGRFRGPNGSGVGKAGIPAKWEPENYKWRTPLPWTGHNSPVLYGDKIFVNGAQNEGKTRVVACLDSGTGKLFWHDEFPFGTHNKHKQNSYASSCPAVDEGRVYSAWGHKDSLKVVALAHSGELVWERELGGVSGGHGFGVSPIIYGGLLILPNDQENGGGFIIALDKLSGETKWKVPRGSKRLTYATPCIHTPEAGAPQLILSNWWLGITSLDPYTGKQNWEADVFGKPHPERAIASPLSFKGLFYGTCGFTTKDKHLVAMDPETGKEAWRVEKSVPRIPTPIIANGLLFLWGDGGIVSCLDPLTGTTHWRERIVGVQDTFFGSPVASGDVIFCSSAYGKVVAILASDKFEQLAVNDLEEECRSTPAIANGSLFIRTFGSLVCIGP
jgi:outer membrane protein assembly factor BamB